MGLSGSGAASETVVRVSDCMQAVFGAYLKFCVGGHIIVNTHYVNSYPLRTSGWGDRIEFSGKEYASEPSRLNA